MSTEQPSEGVPNNEQDDQLSKLSNPTNRENMKLLVESLERAVGKGIVKMDFGTKDANSSWITTFHSAPKEHEEDSEKEQGENPTK